MAPAMSYTAGPSTTAPVFVPSMARGPSSIYPSEPSKNLNNIAIRTKMIILCVLIFVIALLLATTICLRCGRDRRRCCVRKSPERPENPLLKIKGGKKKKRSCLKRSPVPDHSCSNDEDNEPVRFIDKIRGYMRNIWLFLCCGLTVEDSNPRQKPVEQTVISYGLPTPPSSPCSICVQSQTNAVFPREHTCPEPIRLQTPSRGRGNQSPDIPNPSPHTLEMERLQQIERGLGDLFRTYVTPKKDHIVKPERARFSGLDGCVDASRPRPRPLLAMLMVRSSDETKKTKTRKGEMKLIIFGLDGVLPAQGAL